MQKQDNAEDQQKLPNFGQGNPNPMFTQSAYTPSTQTIRVNHQMESQSSGQPMYRSTASPMHIDLGAAQQQFQMQQNSNMSNQNIHAQTSYTNHAQESPFTPPRKHPLISNGNTNNTTAVTKMRGYTPTTASGKVPQIPIAQQVGSNQLNTPFGSAIQREISPINRDIPMMSYNKALDSVAILGNEFESTIKAFVSVQEELNIWREKYQKQAEVYEAQSHEEKQEYYLAQQKLEQSQREIEKLQLLVDGVNQKLEFNSQKMKTLERKCQDYSVLEQKYNQLKLVNREQEGKIKVLETELTGARELIEMKDREIIDLEVYKREYADVQEKLQQLEKENNDLKNNIQDRDKTLEQYLNSIEQLSNQNSILEKENQEMKNHIEQFEREVNQVHDEIDNGLLVASSNINTSKNFQSQQYAVEFSQQYVGGIQQDQNLHISHPHGEQTLGSGMGEIPQDFDEKQDLNGQQTEEEGSEYEEVEIEVQEEVPVEEHIEEDRDNEEEEDGDDEEEYESDEEQNIQKSDQYRAEAPIQQGNQSIYQQHPDETVQTLREQQFNEHPENTVRTAQAPQMYMTQQYPQQYYAQNQYYSQHGQQALPQQYQQQQQILITQPSQEMQPSQYQQQYTNNNNLNMPPEYMDVQNPLVSSVEQSVQSSVKSTQPQQMNNQSFYQNQTNQYSISPRKASFGIQTPEQQQLIHQQISNQLNQNRPISGNNLETLHSQHSSVAQQSQYMTAQQIEEQQQLQFTQSQNFPQRSVLQSQQQQPTTSQIIKQQQQNITQSTKVAGPANNLSIENYRMAQTTYNPQQQNQIQQQSLQKSQPGYERQQCIVDSQQQSSQALSANFQELNPSQFQSESDQQFIPQLIEDISNKVEGVNSQIQSSQISQIPDQANQRRISDLSQQPDNLRQTASVLVQNNQQINTNFYSQKLPQFQTSPKQVQSIRNQQQPILQNQSIQQSQYIQYSSNEQEQQQEKDQSSEQIQEPPQSQQYDSTLQFQNQFSQHYSISQNNQYGPSSQDIVYQGVSEIIENQNNNINATTSILQEPAQIQQNQKPAQVQQNIDKLGRGSLRIGQAQDQQQHVSQLGSGSVQLNKNQPSVNVKNLMEAHQQSQSRQAAQNQQAQALDEIQEENLQSQIQNIPEESQHDSSSIAASASQPHHLLEQQQQHFAQQDSVSSSSVSQRSQTQTMQQPPVIQISQQQLQANLNPQQEGSTFLDQTDEEPLQISTSQFVRIQNSVQQAPQMIISNLNNGQDNLDPQGSRIYQANVDVGQNQYTQNSIQEAVQLLPQINQPIQQTQSVYVAHPQQQNQNNFMSTPHPNVGHNLSVPGQVEQQQQLDSSQQQSAIQFVQSQQNSYNSSESQPQFTVEQPAQKQQLALPQSNISQIQSVYLPATGHVQPQQNLVQSQPQQPNQYQSFGPAQNQNEQNQLIQQSQDQQKSIIQSQYTQQEGPVEEEEELQASLNQQRNRPDHDVQSGIQANELREQLQQGGQNPMSSQSVYVPSARQTAGKSMTQSQPLQPQLRNFCEVENQIMEQPLEEEQGTVYQPQESNSVNQSVAQQEQQQAQQQLQQHQLQFISQSQVQQPQQIPASQGQIFHSQVQRPVQGLQLTQQQNNNQQQAPLQAQSVVMSSENQQVPEQEAQQQQHQPQFISQSQVQPQKVAAQGQMFHSQAQRPIQGLQVPQNQQQAEVSQENQSGQTQSQEQADRNVVNSQELQSNVQERQSNQPQFISQSQVYLQQAAPQGQIFHSQAQRQVQGLQVQVPYQQDYQQTSNQNQSAQEEQYNQQQQHHQPQFISQSQVQSQQGVPQGQLFHSQAQRPLQGLLIPQKQLQEAQAQSAPQEQQQQQANQEQQHQPQFISQSQVQQQAGVPQGQIFHSQVQKQIKGLQAPQQSIQQQVNVQSPVAIQALPVDQSQQQQQQAQLQVPAQQSQYQTSSSDNSQQRILPTSSIIVYPPAAPQVQSSSQFLQSQNQQPREAISTLSIAPVTNTNIPSDQSQRQDAQNVLPNHIQISSYYIPQQQQSVISFNGTTQQSQQTNQMRQSGQLVQSQIENSQQRKDQSSISSINEASITAIPPNSQVLISNIVAPMQASQVDKKKKKKKDNKKNMTQSEAPIIREQTMEDSLKVKRTQRPQSPRQEGSEASMSKTSIPMTKTVVTKKKVLVKKKKSIEGSQSQSSIKKSSVSGVAAPGSISSNMSKTQIPPKSNQLEMQSLPQFGKATSQKMESSTPLSPNSQSKIREERGSIRPSLIQRQSSVMTNSQQTRTVTQGNNNMLEKIIFMKNQLLEKNNEIDSLKLRIDENLKQIAALSEENSQLNMQNSQTREELEQTQKQLQENFEFHKSEIDNLRQEYENTIAPLLQEKNNLEESNLALSKQCEAFDIALQNSDEEKQRAIRELINEKEQLQNLSEVILKDKDKVINENIQLKDEQSRRIKMENQLIKDNEDLKNLSASQQKDIDTWKIKYKNLKKEINGLRLQFDSYKNQILHEIQSNIQDKASNFQGILTTIKKKYHDQGDSQLSSARDMIIQQDQQEQIQAPVAFSAPRQQQQQQQQQPQYNNYMSQSQQYHPQQQQYANNYITQSHPQPSHQKSHSVHSYAPIHTTEFIPQQPQNDEQFLNELKYRINALKQTQAEQEALQLKSQQQLQSLQIHQNVRQQFLSVQKNQSPQQIQTQPIQQFENSADQTISEQNYEDSQQMDQIEFQIEQLMVLKNQYEQALGRVNSSMSPQKRK